MDHSVFQAEMAKLQAICFEILIMNSNSSGFETKLVEELANWPDKSSA